MTDNQRKAALSEESAPLERHADPSSIVGGAAAEIASEAGVAAPGRSLRERLESIARHGAKFAVVGALAYVVDTLVFTLLTEGVPGHHPGPLAGHDKISSASGTVVAACLAWYGNKYWAFRGRPGSGSRRDAVLFAIFNLIGLFITMGCLVLSRDVLELRTGTWNYVARTIGIGLGTIFRFFTYRYFVFHGRGGPTDGDALGAGRPGPNAAEKMEDV